MKVNCQSDEDLQLEIEQIQHELAALEVSIKRKKLRLSEIQSEQAEQGRTTTGQSDRNYKEVFVDDRVKVLTPSKNKSFVNGTEAIVTGTNTNNQVTITSITDSKKKTWREAKNLELLQNYE